MNDPATDNLAVAGHEFRLTNPSYAAYLETTAGKIIAEQAARIAALEKRHADHLAAWQANRETLAQAAREVISEWDCEQPVQGRMHGAIDRLRELVRE